MRPSAAVRATVAALAALSALVSIASVAATTTVSEGVTVETDVPYDVVDGLTLRMDVYRPDDGTHPGVLLLHGGGFTGGDKEAMRQPALALAAHGYAAFSIDYRLAPEYPYPAAVEDAASAVEHVRTRADRFHVDPRRIGAMGSSAGGTIVASLGTERGRGSAGPQVAAVVTWSGIMDLSLFAEQRPSDADVVRQYVSGRAGVTLRRDDPRVAAASPVHHVGAGSPPMLVAHSREERVPYDQALAMESALRRAGVSEQLFTASRGHALEYEAEVIGPTLEFLDRYVRDFDGVSSPAAASSTQPGGLSTSAVLVAIATVVLLSAVAVVGRRRRGRPSTGHPPT